MWTLCFVVTVTFGVVGQGGKVTVVHMSLASIQSSVQNVMLFCKKRFMIFKINLVNLFLVVIFFKMVIFQMAEFPPTYPPNGTLSLIFSPLLDINKWHLFLDLGKISWQYSVLVILNDWSPLLGRKFHHTFMLIISWGFLFVFANACPYFATIFCSWFWRTKVGSNTTDGIVV